MLSMHPCLMACNPCTYLVSWACWSHVLDWGPEWFLTLCSSFYAGIPMASVVWAVCLVHHDLFLADWSKSCDVLIACHTWWSFFVNFSGREAPFSSSSHFWWGGLTTAMDQLFLTCHCHHHWCSLLFLQSILLTLPWPCSSSAASAQVLVGSTSYSDLPFAYYFHILTQCTSCFHSFQHLQTFSLMSGLTHGLLFLCLSLHCCHFISHLTKG